MMTIIVTDFCPEDPSSTDPFRYTAVVKGDKKRRRGGTGPTEVSALAWLIGQFPREQRDELHGATIERQTYSPPEYRP